MVLQVVAHQAAAPGNEGNEDDDGAAAAPAAPPAPAKPRRRLVPPMCGETFIKFVYRFLLLEGIAATKRLTCKGCRQGKHTKHPLHTSDVNSCQVTDSLSMTKVLTEGVQ